MGTLAVADKGCTNSNSSRRIRGILPREVLLLQVILVPTKGHLDLDLDLEAVEAVEAVVEVEAESPSARF